MKKFPHTKKNYRILIICEGSEEYDYIQRLKECNLWNDAFDIDLKNAESITKISSLYEYNYQNNNYQWIVIFCDTEQYPYQQFLSLIEKINQFHGNKKAKDIVFFANPCTMQIILSHFEKVKLTSNAKSKNSKWIKRIFGIENYTATEKQRKIILQKIDEENYKTMEKNISTLSSDYKDIPSTNAYSLFLALDRGDKTWIKSINKRLEK